jgi:hypothetical protein
MKIRIPSIVPGSEAFMDEAECWEKYFLEEADHDAP